MQKRYAACWNTPSLSSCCQHAKQRLIFKSALAGLKIAKTVLNLLMQKQGRFCKKRRTRLFAFWGYTSTPKMNLRIPAHMGYVGNRRLAGAALRKQDSPHWLQADKIGLRWADMRFWISFPEQVPFFYVGAQIGSGRLAGCWLAAGCQPAHGIICPSGGVSGGFCARVGKL